MRRTLPLFFLLFATLLTACGTTEPAEETWDPASLSPSLTYQKTLPLDAATQFTVDRYAAGYSLVTIADETRYLVIPEGGDCPDDLTCEVVPLYQPLDQIYLAGSAAMDMLVKLDTLDAIAYSALPAKDWTIPEARTAMETGSIVYAGKYSAPDYELICGCGCDLALENTMLNHSPEIKERLEGFGIPVLIDYASYEATPLGRMEWIKLYGVLLDKEDLATEVYGRQAAAIQALDGTNTGQTVAFFYLSSNGEVKVRRSNDYIPQLIQLAGGRYVFTDLGEDSRLSTVTLQWEQFYAQAKDADVIIYNSTVSEQLADLAALTAKNPLLADFAAVQDHRVYCTRENFYQASMELGDLAADLHRALTGQDVTYLYPLE